RSSARPARCADRRTGDSSAIALSAAPAAAQRATPPSGREGQGPGNLASRWRASCLTEWNRGDSIIPHRERADDRPASMYAAPVPHWTTPSCLSHSQSMDKNAFNVRAILAGQAPADAPVTVKGWVRTRRDSKAGISFVHLSDGSAFHPVQ